MFCFCVFPVAIDFPLLLINAHTAALVSDLIQQKRPDKRAR